MLSELENNQSALPSESSGQTPHSPEEDLASAAMDIMPAEIYSGDVVKGRIVKVSPQEVVIDVGLKSEGVIPLEDFAAEGGDVNLFVGKDIDVMVLRREGREGQPVLSRSKAIERMGHEMVQHSHKTGEPVKCRIVEKTKGGFKVSISGVSGFMPFSQSGVRRGNEKALDELVGKEVEAKVTELRARKGDVVLSRRAYLEETRNRLKKETMENLEVGKILSGKVKGLTSFGAFIDLGGIDALLHINDMAWHHVASPKEVVHVGQPIEVKVLSVEGEKIAVGLKQKTQDPWVTVPLKYKEGAKIRGRVTSLTKYGAFLEIEPGVEGLIHISEMSWTKHVKHPSDMFKEGDSVLAVILKVNPEEKRISLGYKQTMPDPWKIAKEKYPSGTRIQGEVTGLTEFGAFVKLEEGLEGLIHVSDLSWTQKVRHPGDVLNKGDQVEAVVREVDDQNRRISLSLKHIMESPWDQARRDIRSGSVVEVTVKKLTDFGAFCEIAEGVEGLVHISELSEKKVAHPSEVLKVGDRLRMKVLKFEPSKEKINLSLKAFHSEEDRREMKKYMEEEPRGLTSMGELINSALQKKRSGDSPSADD